MKIIEFVEQILAFFSISKRKNRTKTLLFIFTLVILLFASLIIVIREGIIKPYLRKEFSTQINRSNVIVIEYNNNQKDTLLQDSLIKYKKELVNIKWQNNHKFPNCMDTIKLIIDNKIVYYIKLEKVPIWNSVWVYKKKRNNLSFIGIIDTKLLNKYFKKCKKYNKTKFKL